MAEPWEYQPEPENYVMADSVNTGGAPTFFEERPNYVELPSMSADPVTFFGKRPLPRWGWGVLGVVGVVMGIGLVSAVVVKR